MLNRFVLVILALLACHDSLSADDPAKEGFRDDFIGKYDPAWQIINENPDNISLTKQPGMLTITTERGGIWKQNRSAKNIFLIDNPLKEMADFVMTTRIFGVDPKQPYQQAGLLCFDDFDNYLKFDLEFDDDNGGKTLAIVPEVDGVDGDNVVVKVNEVLNELWLRIVKFDNEYVMTASRDGTKYVIIGKQVWGTGRPTQIGLIAKNGSARAEGLDVHFDEFEIVPLDTQPELKNLINGKPFEGSEF